MTQVSENRAQFLAALRSGDYPKGTIRNDSRGRPIVDGPQGEGWCACALMHDMFYSGPRPGRNYLKALKLTPRQCGYIQRELNDTPLTFPEIADRIEQTVFAAKPPMAEAA